MSCSLNSVVQQSEMLVRGNFPESLKTLMISKLMPRVVKGQWVRASEFYDTPDMFVSRLIISIPFGPKDDLKKDKLQKTLGLGRSQPEIVGTPLLIAS